MPAHEFDPRRSDEFGDLHALPWWRDRDVMFAVGFWAALAMLILVPLSLLFLVWVGRTVPGVAWASPFGSAAYIALLRLTRDAPGRGS